MRFHACPSLTHLFDDLFPSGHQVLFGSSNLSQVLLHCGEVVVDPFLQSGTVPSPGPELELALVNGTDGAQTDRVHKSGVALAKVDLKEEEEGNQIDSPYVYTVHIGPVLPLGGSIPPFTKENIIHVARTRALLGRDERAEPAKKD